jgi:nucleoside-diphosphate-sugar epimerase
MSTRSVAIRGLTILGAGYVGGHLRRRFPAAVATRRQPSAEPRSREFRLDDRATWRTPPLAGRAVVWTFPAEPLELVAAFHDACLRQVAALIVLGSTSAYRVGEREDQPVVTVSEDSPLEPESARVAGEEWLRSRGATVLQLAGIFGPGRRPEDWLLRRRITDGGKLVNLVHVDDIVAVIAHLLEHPQPGRRINVANGHTVAWRELVERFRRAGTVPADFELPADTPGERGKRVDTRQLRALLPDHEFRVP